MTLITDGAASNRKTCRVLVGHLAKYKKVVVLYSYVGRFESYRNACRVRTGVFLCLEVSTLRSITESIYRVCSNFIWEE